MRQVTRLDRAEEEVQRRARETERARVQRV